MPIVDVEVVTSAAESAPSKGRLQTLADELGDFFHSEPGGTWVRLRSINPDQYAENKTVIDAATRPTFVTVLRAELPDANQLRLARISHQGP